MSMANMAMKVHDDGDVEEYVEERDDDCFYI